MIAVDTNILVRYFVGDDEEQTRQATQLIETVSAANPAWLNLVVLAELCWVLESHYRYPPQAIADCLLRLLIGEGFVVEEKPSVHEAYTALRGGHASFSDAVIAAVARVNGCTTTYTFDRKASRYPGFTLLNRHTSSKPIAE